MKNCKLFTFVVFCFAVFVSITSVYGQEGYVGPGGKTNSKEPKTVTINQARMLPDDSWVILTGSIIYALGDEWYRFRDTTGDILVEIDRGIWRGLSVGENDSVEITGKLNSGLGRTVIDVKSIRKI
jgi:uncharacterized protein (TIGR00156 family)